MPRWLPFAIAIFMLTPFALWAGMGGAASLAGWGGLQSEVGWVLLVASLPLAGLFWVQNLRQIGDSMGRASRLKTASRLASLLPLAIAGLGLAGAWWLGTRGTSGAVVALVVAAVLVLALLGGLAARAPIEPGLAPVPPESPADMDAAARQWLLALGNIAMALLLLSYYWTPWVLFWAALAAIPVLFLAIAFLALWGTQGEVAVAQDRRH